jgi:hypothetical protein
MQEGDSIVTKELEEELIYNRRRILNLQLFSTVNYQVKLVSPDSIDVNYSLSSGYRYGQIINEISSLLAVGIFLFSIRVFFNKNGLIKTLLAGTVVFFAILLLFVALSHIFYPETIGMDNHLSYYKVNDTFRNIELWITALGCATPVFLLPLGYFKLKEKQL